MTAQINALAANASYPEVYSLEESLAILDKYKDTLNQAQYRAIASNIGNFAIENMYLNERDIIRNIQIETGQKNADELIIEQKQEWGLL